ncbi:MAG: methyl-accepting chemotaxis protein [Treponema sp.]|nr:methyl-accepting chemotaxis protein [Treponema sp.]
MAADKQIENYEDAIAELAVGYNKSITLTSVTISSLKILDEAMEQVQNGLSTIVSAFEEMQAGSASTSANTGRIDSMMDKILSENDRMRQEITDRVTEIKSTSQNASTISELFMELEEQTKKVASVTGSIQEVADKTNVLAINASIEAAHAGSFGAGFRIIADEVRKLATQTGSFAREITGSINNFKTTVDKINTRMNEFTMLLSRFNTSFGAVLSSFNDNANVIDQSGKSLSEITGSIREEAEALSEGLRSLEKVNSSMKDTHTILGVIQSSHEFLNDLLAKSDRA